MSNLELPIRAIREMVASAIDLIIHPMRFSDGSRKITAVTELVGLAHDMDIQFQDVFLFQQTGMGPDGRVMGRYAATGYLPSFLQDLRVRGIALDEALFQRPPE
jgi:pilus assembly protein CpaF